MKYCEISRASCSNTLLGTLTWLPKSHPVSKYLCQIPMTTKPQVQSKHGFFLIIFFKCPKLNSCSSSLFWNGLWLSLDKLVSFCQVYKEKVVLPLEQEWEEWTDWYACSLSSLSGRLNISFRHLNTLKSIKYLKYCSFI